MATEVPELDAESKKLIKSLEELEDRIITDEFLGRVVLKSLKTLEEIFGKDSMFTELLNKLKAEHKTKRLEVAARRSIKKCRRIERSIASAGFPYIDMRKSSMLTQFLKDSRQVSLSKLMTFWDFFEKKGAEYEVVFKKGNSEEVKKKLKEYIELLTKKELDLKENLDKMANDVDYDMSLHRVMAHEIAHWVFNEFLSWWNGADNGYGYSMREAHGFALQAFLHVFEKDYEFTEQKLLSEINNFIYFVNAHAHTSCGPLQTELEKGFCFLIGISVLCDAIARKNGDYSNKDLYLELYSTHTLMGKYALIKQALANLNDKKFQNIITTKLLQKAIDKFEDLKEDLIDDIKNLIKKSKQEGYWEEFGKPKNKLIKVVGLYNGIINHNLRPFTVALDILRILGYEEKAKEYRDEYLASLNETIKKNCMKMDKVEREIYNDEKGTINGLLAVIRKEEKLLGECVDVLSQTINGLNFQFKSS